VHERLSIDQLCFLGDPIDDFVAAGARLLVLVTLTAPVGR
jgi:hypothetical protein